MTLSSTLRTANRQPRRRLPGVETLEGRTLLTAGLSEFTGPFSSPVEIVNGPDGNLWVLNAGGRDNGSVVVIAPDQSVKATYTIPTAHAGASSLTVGPDGNLWFVEQTANQIGKITPDGTITEYPIPNSLVDAGFPSGPLDAVASPTDIVAGADGALYFTESSTQKIGRITTNGAITTIDANGFQPQSIAVGSDHLVWFTDSRYDNTLDRVNGDGTISTFAIPSKFAWPTDLTLGPDGSLYFVESANHSIGKVTPDGIVTETRINADMSSPQGLTFDKDGNLWVTGSNAGLVRITPGGVTTPFGPSTTALGNLESVTIGPDGAVWVTDVGRDQIGRLDPSAVVIAPTDHTLALTAQPNPLSWSIVNQTVSGDLATLDDSNPSSVAADFTVQIAWGDGQTSVGALRSSDVGSYLISGDHTYSLLGTYSVTFTAVDTNLAHTPQPNTSRLTTQVDISIPLFNLPGVTPVVVTLPKGSVALPGAKAVGSAPKAWHKPLVVTPPAAPRPVTLPDIRALVALFEQNLLQSVLLRAKKPRAQFTFRPVKPLSVVIPRYLPAVALHHSATVTPVVPGRSATTGLALAFGQRWHLFRRHR